MRDKAKRTHARRTCVTCKARKARCELPDIEVQSRPGKPLPADKACHRCRTLSLDCHVDPTHDFLPARTGAAAKLAAASPSRHIAPSASPQNINGGESNSSSSTKTTSPSNAVGGDSLFNMFSVTPQSSSSNGTTNASATILATSTPSTYANEAAFGFGDGGQSAAAASASSRETMDAERLIFSRCLDLIAKPLSHLERLINARVHTQTDATTMHTSSVAARMTTVWQGPGALHRALFKAVDERTAKALLPSLLSLLLFAPYLPHPDDLRAQCRRRPTLPLLFLLAAMYLIALRQADNPSAHKRVLQVANIVEQVRERVLSEALPHTYVIMGLDLLNTYDSLSETTKLAVKGSDELDYKQVPFRVTRGEATMNRALCRELAQQRCSSRDGCSPGGSTWNVLWSSVRLNAMHILEDRYYEDSIDEESDDVSSAPDDRTLTAPLDQMTSSEDQDQVQFQDHPYNSGMSNGFHRARILGVVAMNNRLKLQGSILQAQSGANRACRRRMEGISDDARYATELDLLVATAERQLSAAGAEWESGASSSKSSLDDEKELLGHYLQLETCAARFDILSVVYRSLVWPSLGRRVDVFPPVWLDDPLVGHSDQMAWHRLNQVEVSNQIVHLMKYGGDGPLRSLGRKYAAARQDAAEESMAIFLSLPPEQVGLLPRSNVCATLAYSVKLLMETQAAAMEHFDHVMPREKTWKVMMKQVGETLTEMGEREPMRGLYSATGEIITRMHLAVERWKDIYKEKKQQRQQQQHHQIQQQHNHYATHRNDGSGGSGSAVEKSHAGNDWLNNDNQTVLETFWAHDPLDEFFSTLLGLSNDEFAAFIPGLSGPEPTL